MSAEIKVPNHEYLELNYVQESATGRGNNSQLIMKVDEDNPDVFTVIEGRIGIRVGRNRPKSYSLSMGEWDNFYISKVSRGWLLTKTKPMEKKIIEHKGVISTDSGVYKPTGIKCVDDIINKLLSYVSYVINENYTTTVEDISDEMITLGNNILNDLSNNYTKMSVPEFNNKLKVLYAAIPRRIDNLSKHLAKRSLDFTEIINSEQELFDLISNQVRNNNNLSKENAIPTALEAFNLEWQGVTPEEETKIKKLMGSEASRYKEAWKVTNKITKAKFDEFCKRENLTEENGGISHLFHGSRSEYFWSIITNGLTINPSGVITNGKMFGLGTYFANKARKSMGYTSTHGSYWAHGDESVGYLGIFQVATGKTYDVEYSESDLTWNILQQRAPGAHCTFAHAGKSLCNDEIIVYQDCQSTIEYLVEFT